MSYHDPVMLAECIEGLAIKPDGVYVDVTFGGGGHSRAILEQLGPQGRLLGFDQDGDAARNCPDDDRFIFVPHNFRTMATWLRVEGFAQVDGILADLGVSSYQLDEAERGFSYRFEAKLDMRMNRDEGLTAADLLNTLSEQELQNLLGTYGEVRNARTLARKLVEARQNRRFDTISDLLAVVEPAVIGPRLRYLSQVFQALRIAVNDEMGALRDFLQQSLAVLRPGGRLVIISYHSLEDRPVKQFMQHGNFDGKATSDFYGHIERPWTIETRKALLPSEQETAQNPRARSAKLRIATKK
jgi:16S rRNA (cytosine1402-N4)-methyltransferase